MQFDALIVTCEHASNRVPRRYATALAGARRLLDTHRGYDIGAAPLARRIARRFRAPAWYGEVTRLLIDLNRSPHHRARFSEFSRALPPDARDDVIDHYYTPYRDAVERELRRHLGRGRSVLHLSVHSFTPRLNGKTRRADIGLLYDPARAIERTTCAAWKQAMEHTDAALRVRRNYPYRGVDDGLIPALRKCLGRGRYACIEIEVNQGLLGARNGPARAATAIGAAVAAVTRKTRSTARRARGR